MCFFPTFIDNDFRDNVAPPYDLPGSTDNWGLGQGEGRGTGGGREGQGKERNRGDRRGAQRRGRCREGLIRAREGTGAGKAKGREWEG